MATKDPNTIWRETMDKKTGRIFFVNKLSNKTQWKRPQGYTVDSDALHNPANWKAGFDQKKQKEYFYNKKCDITQWKKPACLDPAALELYIAKKQALQKAVEEGLVELKTSKPSDSSAKKKTKDGVSVPSLPSLDDSAPLRAEDVDVALPAAPGEEADENGDVKSHPDAPRASIALDRKANLIEIKWDPDDETLLLAQWERALTAKERRKLEILASEQKPLYGEALKEQKEAEANQSQMLTVYEGGVKDDDGSSEDDEYDQPFEFNDHRKGWFKRAFNVGRAHGHQTMMTYKKSIIKKAMLARNSHLNAQAIQLFKNIMSFMGDRTSSKEPIPHAQKIVRNMLQSPAGLRDECYLMLGKQVSLNPSPQSTFKGWQLMVVIASSFPCSKQLKRFMKAFLQRAVDMSSERTAKVIKMAQTRFNRVYKAGPRASVPGAYEVSKLMDMTRITVDVAFLDNTVRSFPVDSFTTIERFQHMIAAEIGVSFPDMFALYEQCDEKTQRENRGNRTALLSRRVATSMRVLDVVASWEQLPLESLTEDTLLDDIKKDEYKNKGYGKYETKYNKDFELRKDDLKIIKSFDRFLYKARLVLTPTKNAKYIKEGDEITARLLYCQARQSIVDRQYFYEQKDLSKISALTLQEEHGDLQPNQHDINWLLTRIEKLVPFDLVATLIRDTAWCEKVLSNWKKLKGFAKRDCIQTFFECLDKWPFYGAQEFAITQTQYPDLANPLLLSITRDRVCLCVPSVWGLCEEVWQYTQIITWGSSDVKLIVVVGTIHQHKKLIFGTLQAREIRKLLEDYVRLKLRNRKLAL